MLARVESFHLFSAEYPQYSPPRILVYKRDLKFTTANIVNTRVYSSESTAFISKSSCSKLTISIDTQRKTDTYRSTKVICTFPCDLTSDISIFVPVRPFPCVWREKLSLFQVLALHCVSDLRCDTIRIDKMRMMFRCVALRVPCVALRV